MKRHVLSCVCVLAAASAWATVVEWDFPRLGSCHEGIAFSDGVTGVLVWGGGDTVNLTVGRADLWDHRGGYPWLASQNYSNIVSLVRAGRRDELVGLFKKDTPKGVPRNPYMLPLGRVVVKVPGKVLKHGTLDTETAIGEIGLAEGGKIELAMSKASRSFAMRFPGGVKREIAFRPSMSFPTVQKELAPLGFRAAKVRTGGFDWELPADASVSLDVTSGDDELVLSTRRSGCSSANCTGPAQFTEMRPRFETVRQESIAQWKAFWDEGTRVKVPDPVLQRIYDYGMYRFGAMTDPDGVPAGLQGPWLEDDKLVPWNGDYHFNINVQECYSPAYRGGHFEHLMPLFRMVLAWRPRLRENAKMFVGVDDGYVLPHSVDDRGVCIGGFWTGTIDHASTAWVASMMMKYVRYSGDVAFLKSAAYDFMRGAMNVYCAMMEENDGALSLPLGPSPEWCGSDVRKAVGRNPSFQLAAAHRLAKDLAEAERLLGKMADPRWADVSRRLPAYSSDQGSILLFEEQPLTESHRHHSHLAGLYPFDTVSPADKANREVLRISYENWVCKGTGQWSGWCVPWASILHTHMGCAEAAVHALRSWETFFNNPGHGSLHDAFRRGFTIFTWRPDVMQMDGQCAAVTAVLELMAHETDGKVEFFRGCPESWQDVSFENLALSDGTRVSGRRRNGKTEIFPATASRR